jgi:ribosome biogenesis GTPase
LRKVRKQIKSNRKPKRARRKDWAAIDFDDLDDLYELDCPRSERIMPRGDRERRREIESAVLSALAGKEEDDDQEATPLDNMPGQQGVVVEVSSSLCRVALNGRSLLCSVRGSLSAERTGFTNVVAIGDRVVVSENGADRGTVEAVLPRQSILSRASTFSDGCRMHDLHRQQIIVANVDHLLIVASWRAPTLWPELIDRYLIAAERNGIPPTICVNKVDLAEDMATCRAELRPYLDLGHRAMFTSALTGKGIGKLKKLLHGRTTVLAGMSGVGKSSLLTAVQPDLQIHTQEVSDHSGEGRHTTSQVSMSELEMGGFVVDTPGIRDFALSGLRRADVAGFYPEIVAAAVRCRFGDCTHLHEPDCAVKAAVRQGNVSATRYHNYKCICDSLAA